MGCLLEAVYCLLLKVTHLRTLVSGGVKTAGAIAGVFAVDPRPSPIFLFMLFLWLFLWEIGGQNVPNDWSDIEEDRRLNAKTIPVRLGTRSANAIILGSLTASLIFSIVVFYSSPIPFEFPFLVAVAATGFFLFCPARLDPLSNKETTVCHGAFQHGQHLSFGIACHRRDQNRHGMSRSKNKYESESGNR